jgi:HlyD family secretion protein
VSARRRARLALAAAATAACAGWLGCGDDGDATAVGTLERDRLELVAEASEPVVARPFPEGAQVDAGDLLVRLDPTRAEAAVRQAEGARARAAARLAELVRGPRPERIAEARARLEGAEGRLATARRDLARARDLAARGVASSQEMDRQQAAFDEALAARDAARANLAALVEGTTAEELDQAEAAVAEAEAALAEARLRLERLEVRAPVAGRLDALPFELGERPPAGGVVAVLLADARPYARVYVPESVRARVGPGTPATIRVDGVDEPLRGRVRTVSSDASFTPYFALTERDRGRLVYLAKVDLLEPRAHALPTGVPLEAEFELGAASADARVPPDPGDDAGAAREGGEGGDGERDDGRSGP